RRDHTFRGPGADRNNGARYAGTWRAFDDRRVNRNAKGSSVVAAFRRRLHAYASIETTKLVGREPAEGSRPQTATPDSVKTPMAQHPITQVEFHPSRNARLGVDSIAPYVVAVVPRQQPDTLQLVKSEPFLGFELDPRALEKLPKPERDNFFAEMLLLDAMT